MLRFLALSVAVHLLLLALPPLWTPLSKPPREAIRIKIVVKPHAPPKPAQSSEARERAVTGRQLTPTARQVAAPAKMPTAQKASNRVMDALLPGASYQYSFEDNGHVGSFGNGHASMATDLRITSDEISGKLDIPLVFRKKNGATKAVAKVVQTGARFIFEYVDGDPYMRAVLYEALRTLDGQEQVMRLFASMKSPEVVIVLKLTVVQGGAPTGETFEDFAVDGHKLTISKTTVLGMTSGFYLPDSEAKRAKRRDEAHLERIKMSPAFTSPLRNQGP